MGSTNGIFRPVLGDRSLFLLDGAEHKRHRKLIAPAFHRGAVRRYSGLVSELAAPARSRPGRSDTPFAIQERMRVGHARGDLPGRARRRSTSSRDELVRELIHELLDLVQNPIAVLPAFQRELGGRSPFAPADGAGGRDRRAPLRGDRLAPLRPQSLRDRDDILSMLVSPQPHEPGFMSDREIRDELITLLIAGHETTATALSWTFERLLRHPAGARSAPRDELETGDDDAYVDAVVRETLRQRPVLADHGAQARGSGRARTVDLPEGLDPDALHLPDPQRPRRLSRSPSGSGRSASSSATVPATRVWLPFGAGPRHCIGSAALDDGDQGDPADRSEPRRARSRPPRGRGRSCAATSRSARPAAVAW